MSPKSTSAMSPRETKWENPIRRAVAQSSTEVSTAPDWATKANRPGKGRDMREAGVEADAGHHDPQTVGADDPQQVGPRRLQQGRLKGLAAAVLALRKPGGDHHGGAGAFFAQLADDLRDGLRRGGHHRQVRGLGQGGDVREGAHPLDGVVFGVHRKDITLEAPAEKVA